MNLSRAKKISIIISIVCVICSILGVYYYFYYLKSSQDSVYEFNPACDTQPILDIFQKNRHELTDNDDFSPEFMMKNRAPGTDQKYFGALKIKVMRENGKLAGFVTYYMKTPQEGHVLLLAVGHDFRGKRYGYRLMKYAMKDLLAMGVESVSLAVSIDNVPARRVYEKLGFVIVSLDDTNAHLEYYPAS